MIIITGGAGFIGANLVASLEKRGGEGLVVCDVFGQGAKWNNLAKRELRDIIAPDQLFPFLEAHRSQIKAIFHLGALSATTGADVDAIVQNNLRLSMDLLTWCGQQGVRFIYASSASTYGDGEAGFKDGFSREDLATLRPFHPYGWSKHMFDRAVAYLQDCQAGDYALPPQYVGLKFFNVYGPNEYHKGSQMSVIPQFYSQIQQTGKVSLFKSDRPDYADGDQARDFVYVDDCVDVMLWLYDNPQVSGLYNVGTGKARTFADLARAIFASLGQEAQITYRDLPEALKGQYQYYTQADLANLRAAGYGRPFTSLEEGVKDYVQNFLMQSDPYR